MPTSTSGAAATARSAFVPFEVTYTTRRPSRRASASSLGELVEPYQQSWSHTIRRIRPQTDRVVDGGKVLNEHLHTDGTDWPRPNDLTCLLCIRPDQNGGGRSRLLPLDRLLSELRARDKALLNVLFRTPVPWAIAAPLGGGVRWETILSPGGVRWLKYTIDLAVSGGADLEPALAAAIEQFEQIVDGSSAAVEFLLQAGNLLLVNNAKCMHARTPIPDVTGSERMMSRIKVMQ